MKKCSKLDRKKYKTTYVSNPNNRVKIICRKKTEMLIKSCKLIRIQCVICGEINTHGHHNDYHDPEDITWFCTKHHAEHHSKLNKLNRLRKFKCEICGSEEGVTIHHTNTKAIVDCTDNLQLLCNIFHETVHPKPTVRRRAKFKPNLWWMKRKPGRKKGYKVSTSTKFKISIGHKGLKHSEEAKLKMSASHKGKKYNKKISLVGGQQIV